jgi:hypothetical protein
MLVLAPRQKSVHDETQLGDRLLVHLLPTLHRSERNFNSSRQLGAAQKVRDPRDKSDDDERQSHCIDATLLRPFALPYRRPVLQQHMSQEQHPGRDGERVVPFRPRLRSIGHRAYPVRCRALDTSSSIKATTLGFVAPTRVTSSTAC